MNHREPMPLHLFVTGTDTGAGKTVVSLLLLKVLHGRGHMPRYFKPLQTGCISPSDADSDARFIHNYHEPLRNIAPEHSTGLCFKSPKAPLYAARDEGRGIEAETVLRRLASLRREKAPLVAEGAGGLLVPVTPHATVIDIIEQSGMRPVLVARTGLGTINHTLLSLEVLRLRNIKPAGIVFVEARDEPTPAAMIQENMDAVSAFSGISVSGVVPHISDFHSPPRQALAVVERLVDGML
ncbi:dethiobiotin synthase [Oleidesulfovibrio alaskensis G20]|jgi:dethiobiotin synthetase|uniref:ATP-dependent dethiobiotin synthetase BioD n=1 Tax=Oleidesulfovibrio alaskensis (strain ATCC BAA-1058 / DSM 17464 / G20) TaxID=207559 RepID=Q30XY7_OLEA2|nr:dethiobiotin synthase [Oleidesulfovibrio alaskensis]ABB39459.1 dethiobiotin synthase [Oleidesulfovibrio alaskensis G20]MBG0772466.1 dethiobiotin synthase [Oleidesulfovibrio alaskensis]